MEATDQQDRQGATATEPERAVATDSLPDGTEVPGRARADEREAQDQARRQAAVEAYARDHEGLTTENEIDALDEILGGKPPAVYTVPVEIETEGGVAKLLWDVLPQDARVLDRIERRNRNETTGDADLIANDAEVLATATVALRTPSGRTVKLDSPEFLTLTRDKGDGTTESMTVASPADALEARFRKQWGLCAGVANEVRRISGYDRSKVGSAQRRLVVASGNS